MKIFNPSSVANTFAIAFLVSLGPLSTDMYLPALPGMVLYFSTESGLVQLTLSVFMFGFALAQLIFGPLSDRYGRKPVLFSSLILFIVASIACAFATDIFSLIVFRFFQALGGSAGPVLGRAMVRDIHGAKNSAKVLSHIASVMALAPAVAPIAGGYISLYFGWPFIFGFLTCFALIGLWLLKFKIAETAPEQFRHPKSITTILNNFKTLLTDKNYLGYTLACTFSFAGLFSFLSGSSFVIIEYFKIPEQNFGLLFALVVFGYMAGTISGARMSRYFNFQQLVKAGSLVTLFSGCLMLYMSLGRPTHVSEIIIPMIFFMTGVGLVMPQAMAGALANYPQMAGSASGLLGFIQMTTAASMGAIVGHAYDGTPVVMSAMIAFMGFMATASYYLLIRNTNERPV